jgi:hypothetical protein
LVIVLAGGYAATRDRTAELHSHAFRESVAYERAAQAPIDRGPKPDPGAASPAEGSLDDL